ncbi:MAG: DUF2500 domain-containing protein [Acetatifactor sp.]|nr:DUF2500 domain-containing protein [Acetatifactor sp.]
MGFRYSGFDVGFRVFGIMFILVFIVIIGIFVVIIVKGISTWNKNNNSPRLTVAAEVVSKRIDVPHHRHANAGDLTGAHGYHTTFSTWYYVTFQVDSGDRMELSVSGSEYGMLVDGDRGKLSFQGTRYLSFERF